MWHSVGPSHNNTFWISRHERWDGWIFLKDSPAVMSSDEATWTSTKIIFKGEDYESGCYDNAFCMNENPHRHIVMSPLLFSPRRAHILLGFRVCGGGELDSQERRTAKTIWSFSPVPLLDKRNKHLVGFLQHAGSVCCSVSFGEETRVWMKTIQEWRQLEEFGFIPSLDHLQCKKR